MLLIDNMQVVANSLSGAVDGMWEHKAEEHLVSRGSSTFNLPRERRCCRLLAFPTCNRLVSALL